MAKENGNPQTTSSKVTTTTKDVVKHIKKLKRGMFALETLQIKSLTPAIEIVKQEIEKAKRIAVQMLEKELNNVE